MQLKRTFAIGTATLAACCGSASAGLQFIDQGISGTIHQHSLDPDVGTNTALNSFDGFGQISMGADIDTPGWLSVGAAPLSDDMDWVGPGFQMWTHVQHGEITDAATFFEAQTHSFVEVELDAPMQMHWGYIVDFGETFHFNSGEIEFTSPSGTTWHTMDPMFSNGGGIHTLEAGVHRIDLSSTVTTYLGPRDAGEMSIGMTVWFTPLPAPGALALLGLAGCMGPRRRRS